MSDQLKPGTVLKGTYRIIRFLGEGGAGAVYLAEHTSLGNRVAVKTLFSKLLRDKRMRQRFVEEGVIQANLNHKNIIRVFDIVETENFAAIVMEYVEGSSLDHYITERKGRPPNVDHMTELFTQILDGMAHAHEMGIIHRDIKPANILLSKSGDELIPKITDFGIAKILTESRHTETGTTMGTVHYAAPEQLTDAKSVDHRADVYSLGCTYYEMLTSDVPFDGDTIYAIMKRHIEAPRPDAQLLNSTIPRGLVMVLKRSMSVDPGLRFQRALDMKQEILRVLNPATTANLPGPGQTAHDLPASSPRAVSGEQGPVVRTRTGTTGTHNGAGIAPRRRSSRQVTSPGATTPGSRISGETPAAPRERNVASLVVNGLIAVIALGLVVTTVVMMTSKGDSSTEPDTEEVVSLSPESNSEPSNEGDGQTTAGNEAGNAHASTAAQCDALYDRYRAFSLTGDTPISTAIEQMESSLESCEDLFRRSGTGSYYDALAASLRSNRFRLTLHRLRATRAELEAADPCSHVRLAADEAERALDAIHAASTAGTLRDYETLALRTERRTFAEVMSQLSTSFPSCGVGHATDTQPVRPPPRVQEPPTQLVIEEPPAEVEVIGE